MNFNQLAVLIHNYIVCILYKRPNFFCNLSPQIAHYFNITLHSINNPTKIDIIDLDFTCLDTKQKTQILFFAICLIINGPTQNDITEAFLTDLCKQLELETKNISKGKNILKNIDFDCEEDEPIYTTFYDNASLKNLFYSNTLDGEPFK